jgi:hypothetical protein
MSRRLLRLHSAAAAAACSLVIASSLAAQGEAEVLAGRVVDAATGQPVAGAMVRRTDGRASAETGQDGRFRLRGAPPVSLSIARVGYAAGDTTITARDDVTLFLSPSGLRLAGITVTGTRDASAVSPRYELSPVGIARVPPLAEPDIFRAVATLPGVDQPNGWRSAFHIRGGASDETLILLDGIPLTEPFHMLGLFGGVQLGAVGGATLHLGAPPVHHDDRLSGIIEIRTLVPDSTFYRAHLSLLSGGAVSGRRWRSGSLLAAGRYATTGVVGSIADLGSYGFADVNLRLRQEFATGWTLDATGFGNGDWITSLADEASADGSQASFRPDYRWGSRAGRIGIVRQSESGWRARADVTYSGYAVRFRDIPREGGAPPTDIVDARTDYVKAAFSAELPVGGAHRVSAGADVSHDRFDHRLNGSVEEFGPNTPPTYAYSATQGRLALHLADAWAVRQNLEVSAGLRALVVQGMSDAGPHLAPRFAVRWNPVDRVELSGSAGRLFQTTTQAEEAREGTLGSPRFALAETPNTADAAELGAEYRVGARTAVRATGFAKRYGRIAQLDSASVLLYPSTPYPAFRFGTGASRGGEFLLTHAGDRFDTQLSYTLTHTRLNFGGPDLPPDWDAPHAFKGIASRALGRGWRANVAATVRSGLPYTPVLGTVVLPDGPDAGRQMRRNYVFGATNSRRLPASQRIDVGAEKNGRIGSGTYTLRLQVLNALNRGTMLRLDPRTYYDYGVQGYVLDDAFDRSIPILPSIGLEVHF